MQKASSGARAVARARRSPHRGVFGRTTLTPTTVAAGDSAEFAIRLTVGPEYTSGSSVQKKTRISKAGNKHLRRALYLPALVAVPHHPHLRAFYQHLLARGKFKMQALVAVLRKLLHAFHGMFKTHQPYDGSKLFRPVASPLQEVACAQVAS